MDEDVTFEDIIASINHSCYQIQSSSNSDKLSKSLILYYTKNKKSTIKKYANCIIDH
jgi:hypothetical protein